jgi:hypothetical protein
MVVQPRSAPPGTSRRRRRRGVCVIPRWRHIPASKATFHPYWTANYFDKDTATTIVIVPA